MTPRSLIAMLALSAAIACKDLSPDTTPAQIAIAPSAAATIASGTSLTLAAVVTNAGGGLISAQSVVWTSSDPAVASVSATGVVVGGRVGDASITATAGSAVSTPVAVTVTPGAPTRLVIRTQPASARSGIALTTQPVVDVQDAAGNLVKSSALTVTATIATGGGVITGSTSAAVDGVATFTSLAISGTIGDRTLSFSAPSVVAVTSGGFALVAGTPTRLMIRTQPLGAVSGTAFTTQPVIELRDDSGNLATQSSLTVTANLGNGTGTLGGATATAVSGVATFTTLTLTGPPGDRTLTFTATGAPTISSATFALATAP